MSDVNRRDFIAQSGLVSLGLVSSGLLASTAALANKHSHHHHARNKDIDAIANHALECVKTGERCATHCIEELAHGSAELKDCYTTTVNMVAACRAMASVANAQSAKKELIVSLAKVCADYCDACAAECEKHAKKHAECKTCLDACKACAKACRKIA